MVLRKYHCIALCMQCTFAIHAALEIIYQRFDKKHLKKCFDRCQFILAFNTPSDTEIVSPWICIPSGKVSLPFRLFGESELDLCWQRSNDLSIYAKAIFAFRTLSTFSFVDIRLHFSLDSFLVRFHTRSTFVHSLG